MNSYKKIVKTILFMFSLILFSTGFIGCGCGGADKSSVDIKAELTKWATTTNETVKYYDYYYAPTDIVSVEENTFLPTVKVTDSNGSGVPLVSDKFLLEDKEGYCIKYIVVYDGNSYERRIDLSVVIADPIVYMDDMGECYVGIGHDLPYISVKENDGTQIEHTCKIFDADNSEIEIEDGKFWAKSVGVHSLNIYAQGENGKNLEYKKQFTVADVPQEKEFILEHSDKDVLVNSDDFISKTTCSSYYAQGVKIGDVSDAKIQAGKDYCIQLYCTSELSSYVTFEIEVGDISEYGWLEMEFWAAFDDDKDEGFDDSYYLWHLKAGENNGTDLVSYMGWRGWDNPVTVYIPISYVTDGKLRLSFTQDYYGIGELYIQYIKGVINPFKFIPEVPSTILVGNVIEKPIVNFQLQRAVLATNLEPSVIFNNTSVTLPYMPTEVGTLSLVYEFGNLQYQCNVAVSDGVILVNKSNLISKTSYVYHYGNSYYLGNPASAQYSAEKAYCIQLNCPSEAESYIIFEIEVGDVSAYDHLEMEFWALQSAYGTWYVKTGNSNGTTIASAQGWRGYDNPVTVDIPTTAVSDRKLRLTLYQAYYNTCELYIQYIKGVV